MDDTERTSRFEEPSAIEPEAPHWSLWLVYLVFRPSVFFRTFALQSIPPLVVLTAWLWGMSSAIDRIETRMLQDRDHAVLDAVANTWSMYWIWVVLFGILGGAFYYWIGGWWYRVRLRWSGENDPDKQLARRIYLYSSQIFVVPMLAYTAWQTGAYDTPRDAFAGDDVWGFVLIPALLWSVYVSYRGVRIAFVLRTWLARLWFLILPGAIYAVVLAVIVAVGLAGLLVQAPDLAGVRVLDREAYRLEYPGNWTVDKNEPDYDPDAELSIEPPMADATIRVSFYALPMPSRECVDQTRDSLDAAYGLTGIAAEDRWGRHEGAGYRARAVIEGGEYDVLMFCATEGPVPFEILQVAQASAAERLAPGFDRIRDTFEVRPR